MNIPLIRDTFTANETLGKMQVGDKIYDTIEQPRNHDIPDHSCIPVAAYRLVPHTSDHLFEEDGVTPLQTYALINPGVGVFHELADAPADYDASRYPVRFAVLIHPANWASQLEACIAPGYSRLFQGTVWMVVSSRNAFYAIREALGGSGIVGHTITIQES